MSVSQDNDINCVIVTNIKIVLTESDISCVIATNIKITLSDNIDRLID